MANDILAEFGGNTNLTLTLASLASSTAGVGRQSTIVDNSTTRYQIIHLFMKITTGTTPTANRNFYIYLIKSNGTLRSDGAGASDAAITRLNARLLGAIAMNSATSNVAYYGEFIIRNPGKEWGIIVVHDTGVNLNSTEGNHGYSWYGENPEIQ